MQRVKIPRALPFPSCPCRLTSLHDRLLGVHKPYGQGRNAVTALAGVFSDIPQGEFRCH